MSEVVTLVAGRVDPTRHAAVAQQYKEATTADGLPPAMIEETFLLRGESDRLAILTVWATRQALDAMLASGEEPLARRLIRSAGGTPEVEVFEVVSHAASG